ncbi:helix-turn-helix transcriptional regulator [Curvivirga aplysinae]|uniref:helix-turn-helix transcriptional regulator n=1 Tax=Curvivirga aplysinae TaxID=2529852 RepID=UPI0012BD6C15|nr:hypothetical protein [Curvivirga aplysinae]MTI08408.1 hypothetical protein [Curvivirga aplysinae]
MLTLEDILTCENLENFNKLMAHHEIQFAWQRQSSDYVYTYDRINTAFFEEYYGNEVDLICPAAWAFRSRQWPIFTHEQARAEPQFNSINNSENAYEVWLKHGFVDGIVCLSGGPAYSSFAFFSAAEIIEDLTKVELIYFAATRKLDEWLKDYEALIAVPREFKFLSPKEVETLKLQITQPHLSTAEQAEKLGISQNTLKIRQERITKKFGVKRFIGAALLVERTGFLD